MYLHQVPVGRFQSAKEILSTINSVTGNEIARVYISSISLFIKKKKKRYDRDRVDRAHFQEATNETSDIRFVKANHQRVDRSNSGDEREQRRN